MRSVPFLTNSKGPIDDTLLGEDGWGFMGYGGPWALGGDWLEDGPSIMKEAEPLPSTRAEFGRDISNVLHAAPSPVKSRATEVDPSSTSRFSVEDECSSPEPQSEDEDDAEWFNSDEDLEDLVAAYAGSKPEDHENVEEEVPEVAFENDDPQTPVAAPIIPAA